jgi:hypothetical protein
MRFPAPVNGDGVADVLVTDTEVASVAVVPVFAGKAAEVVSVDLVAAGVEASGSGVNRTVEKATVVDA